MNPELILGNEVALRRVETALPGVCLVRPKVFHDTRGFFLESYHQARLADLGISDHFVQDNHSRSIRGTLRGLHYQLHRPQAKLCRVVEGEVLDVVVDIRPRSPSLGKWISVVLSAASHDQIYVPTGFAHGFLVLSESAQFLYKCSDFYDPEDERGIAWNDPDLNISWGIANPLLSDKDKQCLPLAQIPRQFLPQYYAP
jgi:dTDP-4-dehydrorhamnose 3,5-epimerase